MTEDEARELVASRVPRETLGRFESLCALVTTENERQNLVSAATLDGIWCRHILDSVQLTALSTTGDSWLDIGSGAGFPGLVVAAMQHSPVILVEPRVKRAAFLIAAAASLDISDRVTVIQSRVETATIDTRVGTISARAVAALPKLFAMAGRHADEATTWLLPKGRSAAGEVAEARREWQGDISLVPSLSDPESAIVVARGVRRKTA